MTEYYLVGSYHEIPVYFSRKQGVMLSILPDEFTEPTGLQKKMIISELGGMSTIDRLVRNYERTAILEAKK